MSHIWWAVCCLYHSLWWQAALFGSYSLFFINTSDWIRCWIWSCQSKAFSCMWVCLRCLRSENPWVMVDMYNTFTQELSKIAMPVIFNEPLSFLQRLTEYMEHTYLIQQANAATDSIQRMKVTPSFYSKGAACSINALVVIHCCFYISNLHRDIQYILDPQHILSLRMNWFLNMSCYFK